LLAVGQGAVHVGRLAVGHHLDRFAQLAGHPGQIVSQLAGVGGPLAAVLLEHALDGLLQRRGQAGAHRGQPGRGADADLGHDLHGGLAGEAGLTGQRLEQHRAQREDVDATVDVAITARLLGRGVHGRADRGADLGEALGVQHPAGDAEVEDAGVVQPPVDQEDVAGLDVAVDDVALVRGRQRLQYPPTQPGHRRRRQRAAHQALLQRLAGQPLHGDVRLAVRGDAVIDIADDAGVAKLGQQGSLLIEASGVGAALAVQDLHRDHLLGVAIDGLVHRAHATRARLALQLETVRKAAGRRRGQSTHGRSVRIGTSFPRL
jgi:hypothetical protein